MTFKVCYVVYEIVTVLFLFSCFKFQSDHHNINTPINSTIGWKSVINQIPSYANKFYILILSISRITITDVVTSKSALVNVRPPSGSVSPWKLMFSDNCIVTIEKSIFWNMKLERIILVSIVKCNHKFSVEHAVLYKNFEVWNCGNTVEGKFSVPSPHLLGLVWHQEQHHEVRSLQQMYSYCSILWAQNDGKHNSPDVETGICKWTIHFSNTSTLLRNRWYI